MVLLTENYLAQLKDYRVKTAHSILFSLSFSRGSCFSNTRGVLSKHAFHETVSGETLTLRDAHSYGD